jgi:hypothetical protein
MKGTIMLYTKDSIRFTATEADAYRAQGIDVTQISSYRQFVQIMKKQQRQQRQQERKENTNMGKRYGRRAINGLTEYYDSKEECLAARRRDDEIVRNVFFGIIGAIAGGILTYMLLRYLHVDSRLIRFVAVIVGTWFCGIVSAALSDLLAQIVKLILIASVLCAVGFVIFICV